MEDPCPGPECSNLWLAGSSAPAGSPAPRFARTLSNKVPSCHLPARGASAPRLGARGPPGGAPASLLHMPGRSPGAQLCRTSPPRLCAPQSPVSSPRREDPRRRLSESWTAESETWRGQRGGDGLSAGPLPFCSERRAEAWSFRKLSGQEGRCSSFCPYTEVALGPPDPASRLV